MEMGGTNNAETNKIRSHGGNVKHYKTVETNTKKLRTQIRTLID